MGELLQEEQEAIRENKIKFYTSRVIGERFLWGTINLGIIWFNIFKDCIYVWCYLPHYYPLKEGWKYGFHPTMVGKIMGERL